jgi:phage terminase small subunit
MGLTDKQKAFADYYIETGNAAEAYRRAGYKQYKSSAVEASKALKRPNIANYIAERLKPAENRRIATADEVMEFLTDVMHGRVKDQFGLDPSLSDRIAASRELMKRHAAASGASGDDKVTVIIDV